MVQGYAARERVNVAVEVGPQPTASKSEVSSSGWGRQSEMVQGDEAACGACEIMARPYVDAAAPASYQNSRSDGFFMAAS